MNILDYIMEIGFKFFSKLTGTPIIEREIRIKKKCCGGGCHKTLSDIAKHEWGYDAPEKNEHAPITPVEYDDTSKVRFSREDKKIKRLREYFNSLESEEE